MKILKIHSLEKGWCDKDHVMLHSVFQLLVDFVEQEKPDQIVDWNSDPVHKRRGRRSDRFTAGGHERDRLAKALWTKKV